MKALRSIIKKAFAVLGYEIQRSSEKPEGLRMDYPTIAKFSYYRRIFDMIKDIDGDIVECGVAAGNSLLLFAFLAKEEMKGRKIWGFDSFEGFPAPSKQDNSMRNPQRGQYGDTSIQVVRQLLINSGLDKEFVTSQITLVKGFFNTGDSIALLHLDVDLYDSYLTSLKELYPKVAIGGAVLFDEYLNGFEQLFWPGAQEAIDEYFKDEKSVILRDKIKGKYYLIKSENSVA